APALHSKGPLPQGGAIDGGTPVSPPLGPGLRSELRRSVALHQGQQSILRLYAGAPRPHGSVRRGAAVRVCIGAGGRVETGIGRAGNLGSRWLHRLPQTV